MSTKKPKKKPARRKEGCAKHVGNDVLRECPFRDVCPCVEKIVYVPVYVHPAAPQLGQPWPTQPLPNQPLYPPTIITCHGGVAPWFYTRVEDGDRITRSEIAEAMAK